MRKVKMTSMDAHACMNADVRSLFYLANSQVLCLKTKGGCMRACTTFIFIHSPG